VPRPKLVEGESQDNDDDDQFHQLRQLLGPEDRL
jgi:hypothetical protein